MNAVQVHKAIARTRRRVFLDTSLRTLGWLALLWVGLALLILLLDRLASLALPVKSVFVYGLSGGILFVLAPILAWLRRPNDQAAASLMDDRLGLKDSLGTALYAEQLKDNPFAKQVLEDADRMASSARIDQAFAIRLGKGWGYALPASAVFALLMVFLPGGVDLLGLQQKKNQQEQQQARAEEVQRQVLQANALLKEVKTEESNLVDADPDDVFKELASLTDRDLTNPEFKRETISKLADVQDKLAAAEQAKQQQLNTVKNQMSQLDPKQRGPADRFADAMRRGDFQAAQKELQRLSDSLEGMPDAEKKLLQQQLQNMSDQLQKMADQQQQLKEQAEKNIQQQLQQAGLSQQQIQQLQQQGYNPQAVQQAVQQSLQQQGMSPQQAQQQAQQTAQQVQQQQQQSQNANQSMQQNQGLSSSFGQMAQSLGPQGQPQQQGQQNQQGQQPGQQGQQNQQGQQQGQFSQGAWQSQQQLNQMQQMQQQLNQMQNAQQQLQQAMQGMNQPGQGQGQGQGQSPGQGGQQGQGQPGGQPGQGGGAGGKQAGTGVGNNPLGKEYQTGPYTTYTESDIQQGQGRVIASWQENGEMSPGEATVEFDKAITDARNDAEHAVTEDRVPRRYHDSIKDYFQQLPDSPDQIRQAPAAPR